MRIAIVYLGRRGAGGKITLELARALNHGHEVFAFLSAQAENLHDWQSLPLQQAHVETYRGAASALASLLLPAQTQRLAQQIQNVRPDVLLFPMFHPWNSRLQNILAHFPAVVFVHDPRPHPDLAGWFYEKLENLSIRSATRCAVLSETLKPHLARRGVGAASIDVIPLGPFAYIPSAREKTDRPLTALFFGRIVPYKGIDTLLKAFALLRSTFDCRLILAGEGDLTPYADLLTNQPNLEIINRWIPENEIGNLFAGCDLLVLPYSSASQSGVIPIAAAFGIPVIATRTGGMVEQVEDGVSGWLVDAGDASALADAMRVALSEKDEARRRGEALKARYETQLSWERIAERLVKSLQMAAPARGPRERGEGESK